MKSVIEFLGEGNMMGGRFAPLVAFIFGSSEVVKSFILRHTAPYPITITKATGQCDWKQSIRTPLYLFFQT